jgi:DNA/RNA endonuclease G (NUC1)
MNKRVFISIIIWTTFSFTIHAQKIDRIVNKEIYTSYFSNELKVPLYVVYYLNNGGGDFSRAKLKFIGGVGTAKNSDYAKSGYDRGHLVSAEDFAYDYRKEALTFSYYNCFPQTPRLNRGSWKVWENTIRNESKKWPLKIYTGGIYGQNKIRGRVGIPNYCWKVVYNQKSGLILHALIFNNDNIGTVRRTTISELKSLLKYPVEFSSK